MRTVRLAGIMILAFAVSSTAAIACPICYGDTSSPMTAGMNTAILVMLGITGFVLMTIVAFFGMVWKRYRKQRLLYHEAHVNNIGILHFNQESSWNIS